MGVSSMVMSALTSSAHSSPDLESDILKFTSALNVAEIVARASLSRTCAWGSHRTQLGISSQAGACSDLGKGLLLEAEGKLVEHDGDVADADGHAALLWCEALGSRLGELNIVGGDLEGLDPEVLDLVSAPLLLAVDRRDLDRPAKGNALQVSEMESVRHNEKASLALTSAGTRQSPSLSRRN